MLFLSQVFFIHAAAEVVIFRHLQDDFGSATQGQVYS